MRTVASAAASSLGAGLPGAAGVKAPGVDPLCAAVTGVAAPGVSTPGATHSTETDSITNDWLGIRKANRRR